ncbi:MAG: DNA polymerase-3 subunit delta [Polaribacter sp.]|jgi:DNA polymerase-3 subunit delta
MNQINLLISDETLLVQEASDEIIAQAKGKGLEEVEIVNVNKKYDWSELLANSACLSLFASVKLMDIRLEDKPNKEAQTSLVELLSVATDDDWYIIRFPKLDKKAKATKWFKTISKNARVEEIWPPKINEFPHWIANRAKSKGLNVGRDACALLAEKTEGNLLAASQAIEKLNLLYADKVDSAPLDKKEVIEVISDSCKFTVFLCLDEALEGRGQRAVKMLHKFKQEGQAPIAILVNLTREIQYCNQVSNATNKGQPASDGLNGVFLWENKKRMLINATSRLPHGIWQNLVIRCAQIDKMIKGQADGNVWLELEACLWILSGKNIWKSAIQNRKAI